MKISGVGRAAFLVSVCLLTLPPIARAQSSGEAVSSRSPAKSASVRRALTLEILIQSQPSYRVKAQEWGRILQELGYAPRFREAIQGEKIRIEEQLQEGRASVLVVGGMTPEGGLKFSGRSFANTERSELGKYLAELKEHGAGGIPAGNPRWGLSELQFQEFAKLMSSPLEQPVEFSTAGGTVRSLGLPEEVKVVFSETAFAMSLQARPDFAPESLQLSGISQGTGLAIVLAQYGLGFRPVFTRGGGYVIEIEPGNESSNLWPVGWKTEESTADVLPAWLKSIPFEVEDADVSSLVEAVAEKLAIPHYTAASSLAIEKLDIAEITYSRTGRLSPFGMLRALGDKFALGFDVRADEAGKLFLWTTSQKEAASFNQRFAHIRPAR